MFIIFMIQWIERQLHTISYKKYLLFSTLVCCFLSFIIGLLYNLIIERVNAIAESGTSKLDTLSIILLSLLVAPLIETLIFQNILLSFLYKYIPRYSNFIVATLFAMEHYSSVKQIIVTFFICFIFNYSYLLAKSRKWNPFVFTFAIHSGYNLFVTIIFFSSEIL